MPKHPQLLIYIEGGVINKVVSTSPVEVTILDLDTEGLDPSYCLEIDDEIMYISRMQADSVDAESLLTLNIVDKYCLKLNK